MNQSSKFAIGTSDEQIAISTSRIGDDGFAVQNHFLPRRVVSSVSTSSSSLDSF